MATSEDEPKVILLPSHPPTLSPSPRSMASQRGLGFTKAYLACIFFTFSYRKTTHTHTRTLTLSLE